MNRENSVFGAAVADTACTLAIPVVVKKTSWGYSKSAAWLTYSVPDVAMMDLFYRVHDWCCATLEPNTWRMYDAWHHRPWRINFNRREDALAACLLFDLDSAWIQERLNNC